MKMLIRTFAFCGVPKRIFFLTKKEKMVFFFAVFIKFCNYAAQMVIPVFPQGDDGKRRNPVEDRGSGMTRSGGAGFGGGSRGGGMSDRGSSRSGRR